MMKASLQMGVCRTQLGPRKGHLHRRKWGYLFHSSHFKNCLHGPQAITLLPASLAHPSLEFVRGSHMEVRRLRKSGACEALVQLEHKGGGRRLNCHHM
jgi:hypothetical protein